MNDLDVCSAAIAVSVCLNSNPKSLTRLVFETGLPSPLVAKAVRLLTASCGCRWLPARGFIYWSEEAEEELLSALSEDACRSLFGEGPI